MDNSSKYYFICGPSVYANWRTADTQHAPGAAIDQTQVVVGEAVCPLEESLGGGLRARVTRSKVALLLPGADLSGIANQMGRHSLADGSRARAALGFLRAVWPVTDIDDFIPQVAVF